MTAPLQPGDWLGILGGGQLGRMLAVAARPFGLKVLVWDPASDAPAACTADEHLAAPYDDAAACEQFLAKVARATYEFENIPHALASALDAAGKLLPGASALEVSQDRLSEKTFLEKLGIEVAPFWDLDDASVLASLKAEWPGEGIVKTRRFGYDGKGQFRVSSASDLENALTELQGQPAIFEGFVDFEKEISVILARGAGGQTKAFEATENVHHQGILRTSRVPASVSESIKAEAAARAAELAAALDYVGVLAVEFFVTRSEQPRLIANEFAPRVHNSGHWTMDGAFTSQFAQHIRAVAGWPLADTATIAPTVMENLLGDEAENWQAALQDPHAHLHLYGKSEARRGRKMGHINRLSRPER